MKINFQIFRCKKIIILLKNKQKIQETVYHSMNMRHLFPNNINKLFFGPLKILKLFSSFHLVDIPQQYYRILCCSRAASPRLASRKK